MEDDKEFNEYQILRVEDTSKGDGWIVVFDGSCNLWVPNTLCSKRPFAGQTIRIYGKVFGHVRGIVINSEVYKYQTVEEADAEMTALREQLRKEREEQEEAFRNSEKPKLPTIRIRDEEKWQKIVEMNSQDPYSFECVRFAANWAAQMEAKLAEGSLVPEVASACAKEANTEGITGFMYGAAVSILSECWYYGEALRRWHNKDVQTGTEGDEANERGGVLNPAILTTRAKSEEA